MHFDKWFHLIENIFKSYHLSLSIHNLSNLENLQIQYQGFWKNIS